VRITNIICFILLFSTFAAAQSDVVNFRHYGVADGLSDNNIRCLYFDSHGFLWIGTNEGLNRFDGEEFFHYKKGSGERFSLSGNVITDVIEDEETNLWIATRDGGICHLNRNSGEVFVPKLYNDSLRVFISLVNSLCIGNDGLLYVATGNGLLVSNENRDRFHLVQQQRQRAYYDLEPSGSNMIVAGISTSFALVVNQKLVSNTFDQQIADGIGQIFNDLFRDSEGEVWGGAWDHYLHNYNEDKHRLSSIDFMHLHTPAYKSEEIYAITEAGNRELWLGMKSGTIWKFNTETLASAPLKLGEQDISRLNGNRIHSMITDKHGRTWVGTDAGLHVYNPFNSLFAVNWVADQKSTVNDLLLFNDRLWISTNAGLYYNQHSTVFPAPPFADGPQEAHAMHLTGNGKLWVGTQRGMELYDTGNDQFIRPFSREPLMFGNRWLSTRINAMTSFYIGNKEYLVPNPYGHGTVLADMEANEWAMGFVKAGEKVENLVKNFLVDSDSVLWIVGSVAGVSRYKSHEHFDRTWPTNPWTPPVDSIIPFTIQTESFLQPGISPDATAMIEKSTGTYWVATQGSGLLLFESQKDSLWFSPIKNSPLSIKSLTQDGEGRLWMNASGGLYSYNTANEEWKHYDEKDGIPAAGLSSAILADSEGKVYVGGNGFYLQFNPSQTISNNELPSTKITHLEVMSAFADSLLLAKNVVLPSEQNFLTFHFTSLCFNNAENCTFTYMLDGLDEQWNNNSTLNFVRYNKLPFGEYTFRVRAINSSGVADANEATFHFSIRAPFYMRWWFVALIMLIVAAIVAAILRYRYLQKMKLETVRNKIARDLHDDVGSALGSISYFSATAKKSLDENNLDTGKIVLEKIGSTSREMIENMHDIVWAVNPANDSFDNVMERMKSHAADIASANNIKLIFEADEKLNSLKLSMTERKNLFLIFKESLYNSLKYSGCNTIEVVLARETPDRSRTLRVVTRLYMKISDNGKGFDVEKRMGKGNGLKNMKARAGEMGARFSLTSDLGNGTKVEVMM